MEYPTSSVRIQYTTAFVGVQGPTYFLGRERDSRKARILALEFRRKAATIGGKSI
jgi:hypothetical protein